MVGIVFLNNPQSASEAMYKRLFERPIPINRIFHRLSGLEVGIVYQRLEDNVKITHWYNDSFPDDVIRFVDHP